MKTSWILTALMLISAVSTWAQENYTISSRRTTNGSIDTHQQAAKAGELVKVTCIPFPGFGLAEDLYYEAKGVSEPKKANNTSYNPDDRGNASQTFEFTMPAGNVEVWADFVPLRTVKVHPDANGYGKLLPQYGHNLRERQDTTEVMNVPSAPIKLLVSPNKIPNSDKKYRLLDVEITKVTSKYYEKGADTITIWLPNDTATVHVTPIFGLPNYKATVKETAHIKATLSDTLPKWRDEVEVVLTSAKGYIPTNVTFSCKSWWRVDKPQQQTDGGWKVVYRFKVDLENVAISYDEQRVYAVSVSNTDASSRMKTYIPEMIPDYPGVARPGQQVPVVFFMPSNYCATFEARNMKGTPLIFHNALENSFADEDMAYWTESNEYISQGCMPFRVFADADGRHWCGSVRNSMSQSVSLSGRSFPADAKKDGKLTIAAMASINPKRAHKAEAYIMATGSKVRDSVNVANMAFQPDGWQNVFKTLEVNSDASNLEFHVSGIADNMNENRSYNGPCFDDLCLLLPVKRDSLWNEDVMVFTMDSQDAIIQYHPAVHQDTVRVAVKDKATVTLLNKVTGEEGTTIKAAKNDVIVIKGVYADGYAIYNMTSTKTKKQSYSPTDPQGSGASSGGQEEEEPEEIDIPAPELAGLDSPHGSDSPHDANSSNRADRIRRASESEQPEYLLLDSINEALRTVYYHVEKLNDNEELTITPQVDVAKVNVQKNYGGTLTVSDSLATPGTTVTVTIKANPGCKFRRVRTSPVDNVTFSAVSVDATTGDGTYSFVMPSSYITLIPEFSVPITSAEQFDAIVNQQYGEFYLANDINLGKGWDKSIYLVGNFDGRGHRITYRGKNSLFQSVSRTATVRHLNVVTSINGREQRLGGIATYNYGIIEDCVVNGKIKNRLSAATAAGIAGINKHEGRAQGIISHCHVLCSSIDGAKTYGIAEQEEGATIRDNVFGGQFANSDGQAYIICPEVQNSIVEGNLYVVNDRNERAMAGHGVTEAKASDLFVLGNELTDNYPVFAASLRKTYDTGGYTVSFSTDNVVQVSSLSHAKAPAGTVVQLSVNVLGNNHLDRIVVSSPDGSGAVSCPFTDHMDNSYSFSFVMPEHDVKIVFTTKEGALIYTAKQFLDIDNKEGIYYLARDIDLNNFGAGITLTGAFYGNGHTIRYRTTDSFTGLFRTISTNALLQGLRVVGFAETRANCAGIVNELNGTIRDCHFTGRIVRLKDFRPKRNRIAAIAYSVDNTQGVIDHCSATGELICSGNQAAVDNSPLCCQNGIDTNSSTWFNPTLAAEDQQLRQKAEAASKDYPVYAQGILDRITPRIINGSDTLRLESGQILHELVITDGQPFACTSDVKVLQVIYKRKATKAYEPWMLPFSFDNIRGSGTFDYCKIEVGGDKLPKSGTPVKLTLDGTSKPITYKANTPWMVSNGADGDTVTYVLDYHDPIILKATDNHFIGGYSSINDAASIYATYTSIPAKTAKEDLMYVWDGAREEFTCADETNIQLQPFRFYVQFNHTNMPNQYIKYIQTDWYRRDLAESGNSHRTAPRLLSSVIADGWQPIFLDPRQPQSVTARMLDYYEVACLTDISAEVVDKSSTSPLSAVSLVYEKVNSRKDLLPALPLLVRAKRADAEPLVDGKTGDELDALLLLSLLDDDDDEDGFDEGTTIGDDLPAFDMPHYWCGAFGNRLDIWPLPASESYADLAELGAMVFHDDYYNQSFLYATEGDTRTTTPMSYCITVLNTDTYELLPLIGDRVSVEFIGPFGPGEDTTGMSSATCESVRKMDRGNTYNLSGQRVNASYKGIILQNGRKVIRK